MKTKADIKRRKEERRKKGERTASGGNITAIIASRSQSGHKIERRVVRQRLREQQGS